jgi:transcriptional regulator with XRE-family HTH domain
MANSPTPPQVDLAARLRQLRDELGLTQLDLAKAFSGEKAIRPPTISTWENARNPVRPPGVRLEAYARLRSTSLRGKGVGLVALPELSAEERGIYDEVLLELTTLSDAADELSDEDATSRSVGLWAFEDDGPLTIICPSAPSEARGPLANREDPNYTETHAYADLDALIDVYGHIRAEIGFRFPITYSPAEHYRVEDLSGHLVLVGGIAWSKLNRTIQETLTDLPVRQVEVPELQTGEIFMVGHGEAERRFEPEWSQDNDKVLFRDVGYLARTRNPYNTHRTLTICNGIHSRGVLGAVRTLTDGRFRRENEAYLAEHFPSGEFALLIRVPVVQGRALGADLSNPHSILYEWSGEPGAAQ